MIRAYENHWFSLIGPYYSMEKKFYIGVDLQYMFGGGLILIGGLLCSKQRVGITPLKTNMTLGNSQFQ